MSGFAVGVGLVELVVFAVGEGPVLGNAVVHAVVFFEGCVGEVLWVGEFCGDGYVEGVAPGLERGVDGDALVVEFYEVDLDHFAGQFVPGAEYVVGAGYCERPVGGPFYEGLAADGEGLGAVLSGPVGQGAPVGSYVPVV